ncbi:MAG UNVERIFIED_CONTAM: hypothetical protein LVR29_06950 [Microcystis novacekii LVE1205-3]
MVPKETLLFDGTVQENIALTNPNATVEEIVRSESSCRPTNLLRPYPMAIIPASVNGGHPYRGTTTTGCDRSFRPAKTANSHS